MQHSAGQVRGSLWLGGIRDLLQPSSLVSQLIVKVAC